jgi:hypothetical protein
MGEAIDRETHPESGAHVVQMTSAPGLHSNIYCENPYMDPASRYVFYQKAEGSLSPWELWRADLATRQTRLVAEDVEEVLGCAVSFDQRFFYCHRRPAEDVLEILRIDTTTLEQRVFRFEGAPGEFMSLGAIGPEGRFFYTSARLGTPAEHRFGVLRFDLETGRFDIIHERGDDLCNAHVQVEPSRGRDLLIQHNRGALYDDEGTMLKLVDEPWATLYLIDTDGGNFRQLPVGKPYTQPCQGHQTWIGATGEILLTVVFDGFEGARREGCLLRVRPGDEEARVVARGFPFAHPNASRDGRFWVSDAFGGAQIVVGSIRTGRCRVLVESGSSIGSPQYTHPHPYFSPDCRWAIFNSDRTGIPHIYAATVPEGLLEALDE